MNNRGYRLSQGERQTSHISHALWPVQVQRVVATGKVAQRQRSFEISRERPWGEALEQRWHRLIKKTAHVHLLLSLCILLALSISITLGLLLLFSHWRISLIVFTFLGIIAGFLLHVLWSRRRQHSRTSYAPLATLLKKRGDSATKTPETPLPVAPLVRVLETIDLSAE